MTTQEQLLDHEYDGIREYDNPTPGWWHLIFFVTVLFCFPYVVWYHVSPLSYSIHEAYDADVAEFYRKQFAKFGDLEPDAATIAGLAANPDYMSAVAGTYVGKCASCHGTNGEGLVGPNLTDEHYKNVQTITDIYTVINDGLVVKGMPAWGRQLQQTEVILLSAYVASLRGADLAGPRPAEGEVIEAFPEVEPLVFEDPAADS
ncbi:MAG: cbb3-type cytochrome c oxidase N-terminal domain-containing protein [Phycisphaerales bacterium]